MQFIRTFSTLILVSALLGCSNGVKHKLKVTIAQVRGECLLSERWFSVSGDYIFWNIDNRVEHSHQLIPISKKNLSLSLNDELSIFDDPIYFEVMGGSWMTKDREYLDFMKKKFKNENLELSTAVQETTQGDLYYLNKSNSENPFKQSDESIVFIPLSRTICNLEKNYVMKNAEAIYMKSLFGAITFEKNDTVPYKLGTRTFAEELLDRP